MHRSPRVDLGQWQITRSDRGDHNRSGMEEVVLVLRRQPVLVLVLEWGIDD